MKFPSACATLLSLTAVLAPAAAQFGTFNIVPFVESINTITESFPSSDCAVVEGSMGNELCEYSSDEPARTLLRFSTGVWNKGPEDLVVDRRAHPELFEWGDCHKHWHFRDFTLYELINEATDEVVTGRKQAFCLMDIRKMDSAAGNSQYRCNNQGITVGWADIYSYNLDGQWIDITGVPAGRYTLRVSINPEQVLAETDYSDNAVNVTSDQDSDLILTGSACPGGTGSPTISLKPTEAPTKGPTDSPTSSACANIVDKGACNDHALCEWYNPGGGACVPAPGAPEPPTPTTPPPSPPACATGGAGLGEGCETADDCCSSECEKNTSAEIKYEEDARLLRLGGGATTASTGTCICLVKNSGCTADFQCCSRNCNFSRAKCSGSDLTDPYGNPP